MYKILSKCYLTDNIIKLRYIVYDSKIHELTLSDLPAIKASGKMFCRKCVTGISDALVDELLNNDFAGSLSLTDNVNT